MWARLYDGDRAYKLFKALMRPTLAMQYELRGRGRVSIRIYFRQGRLFQIDANFGGEAGIA